MAEYTLDAETGIASSPTERMVNFFKGIFLDNLSTKVNFKNDECIAIGTPLLIKTQCTEVFPRVGIEYENGNTKFTIPLMISGMDGKFTFTDYKNLVKDISIY